MGGKREVRGGKGRGGEGRGGGGLGLALAWGEAGIRTGFGLDWIRIINCFCFDKKEVAWLDLGFGI